MLNGGCCTVSCDISKMRVKENIECFEERKSGVRFLFYSQDTEKKFVEYGFQVEEDS